ncbi:MAG: glutamate---methylamine ligase [Acidimicrobiaceae bacterium]|jgi:glutamine synthetase|nr:glutamate---methylamine ligase [Acidimicrobiaceae bacterium]
MDMSSVLSLAPSTGSGRSAPSNRDDFERALAEDEIEFLFAMFVDMHGKPCAKLVPVTALDQLLADGAGFAGFAAGPMGQTPASPDLLAMPDLASYMPAPWRPGLGIVQCDPTCEGELWPYAPRVILRRTLDRLAEAGLSMRAGAEVEYFLIRQGPDGQIEVADARDSSAMPCYDARALTRMYDHLTSVARFQTELGWANYASDHEDGNGQFEQNFRYAEPMVTADRIVVFRYMVHCLAADAGMLATFMPKPFQHLTGNGMHMHTSLWDPDGTTELCLEPNDPRGLGLSELAYHYIGGLLAHAPALTALACPTVNSYKRLGAGAPNSGAAWSPAYATYGGNDRTQMLRVPEPGRVENRCIDGAANPYLALTAQIAAGLDGIARQLDPGEPCGSNLLAIDKEVAAERGLRMLPTTLPEALDNLEGDVVLRDALGKTPQGDYVDYFIDVKRAEFRAYHAQVSPWEIDRYLSLF